MEQNQTKPDWAHYYTFYTMNGGKPLYIPKEGLNTWHDLLWELEDHTNFQYNYIEVVINMQRVYYEDKTKLVDIDIKKDDVCIALKKPAHKTDKEKEEYEKLVNLRKEQCMKALFEKLEDDENIRLTSLIDCNENYKQLFQTLTKEYGRLETMTAIEMYEGDPEKTTNSLKSGEAARAVTKMERTKQLDYLKQFLKTKEMQQIKEAIQKNKIGQIAYREIILKIYNKYPKFKEYEPRHQKFVQSELYGKPLDSDYEDDEDQEVIINPYIQEVAEIAATVKKAKQTKTITNETKAEFVVRMSTKASKQTLISALAQANNNLEKAEFLSKFSPLKNVQRLINANKKQNRINIVLQFFNRPQFHKIRASLKGNKAKSDRFVQWVIKQNEDNLPLSTLLARYKDYAVTLLSGQYCIQKPQKLKQYELKYEPALTADQQQKVKDDIDKITDEKMVEALAQANVQEKLALLAVKAARNKITQLKTYLCLGGVDQQFDFCPQNPKTEQLFLYNRWRKEKDLLKQLRLEEEQLLWLNELSVKRPWMFEVVVRNKPFFDKMVNGESVVKK